MVATFFYNKVRQLSEVRAALAQADKLYKEHHKKPEGELLYSCSQMSLLQDKLATWGLSIANSGRKLADFSSKLSPTVAKPQSHNLLSLKFQEQLMKLQNILPNIIRYVP